MKNISHLLLRVLFLVFFYTLSINSYAEVKITNTLELKKDNHIALRNKIGSGVATFEEVAAALKYQDTKAITNLMHALYKMRWHRGVYHLLNDLWDYKIKKYPQLAWEQISSDAARVALASTLNRIHGNTAGTNEYRDYIRSKKETQDSFTRGQVLIALAYNKNSADVPYIANIARGDDHFNIQVSISSLALMENKAAENALKELAKEYIDTPRGELVNEMLKRVYKVEVNKLKN